MRNGPGAAGPGGYGLEGMRERLALVGGRLVAGEVEGESTFDSEVSRRLVRAMLRPYPTGGRADRWSNPDRLTPREVEVLTLIAQGMDNARIAASLFIGETTVKTHVNNVFGKIGARNRSDATRYACRHGLAGEDRAP